MSRWYWGAIACGVGFAIAWLMPEYVRKDGLGGVYGRDVGLGWNWRDADGNPLHDAQGNAIKPNHVRTIVLFAFGLAAAVLAGAGLLSPKRKKVRIVRTCEEHFPDEKGP
jgi:hypothetical protein